MSRLFNNLKSNIANSSLRPRLGYILLGFAVLILQMLMQSWIVLIAMIVFGSYGLGLRIRPWFFNTKLSVSAVGFMALCSIISSVATVFWIFNINVPLDIVFFVSYSIALFLIFLFSATKDGLKNFDIKDSVAVFVVVAYISLLVFGGLLTKIKSQDMNLATAATQFVSYSVDDISHINMYKDHLEADKGLVLGDKDKSYISKPDHLIYPKVAHLIPATIYSTSVDGEVISASKVISSYAIFKVALFSLAIFVLIRSSLAFIGQVDKKRRLALIVTGSLIGLLIVLGFVNVFIQEGFFSVWPIFLCLPVLVLMLKRNLADLTHSQSLFVGMSLAMIFMSWPIMALPISLSIAFSFAFYTYKTRSIPYLKAGLVGTALLGLAQIYAQSLDPAAASNSAQFSTPGGIPPFNLLYFMILVPLSIAGLAYFHRRERNSRAKNSVLPQMSFIIASVVLCLCIGLINLIETGHPQYFYYKSSYITLAILGVFYIPLIINLSFKFIDGKFGTLKLMVVSTFLVLIIGTVINLASGKDYIRYVYLYSFKGERHVSSSAARLIYQSDSNSKELTFIIDMDSRINNYYNQAYLSALNQYDVCHRLVGEVGFVNMLKYPNNLMWDDCDEVVSKSSRVVLAVKDNLSVTNELSCEEYLSIKDVIDGMRASKEYIGVATCQ